MTDGVQIALITGCASIISGGMSGLVVIMMKNLTTKVDGRLTELLTANKRADHAEGVKQGSDAERMKGPTT